MDQVRVGHRVPVMGHDESWVVMELGGLILNLEVGQTLRAGAVEMLGMQEGHCCLFVAEQLVRKDPPLAF